MFRKNNHSGIILIIVLIVLIMIAIVSATIFSQSMSQNKTTRSQVDDIVAQQLAKGIFWKNFVQNSPGAFTSICPAAGSRDAACDISINGRTFHTTITAASLPEVQLVTSY